MNHFVVLGEGNSSANVIEDGLADLPKDGTFHVYTYKTSDEGPCRVYDWLLDNGAKYFAYHNNTAPKLLIDSAAKAIECPSPVEDMVEFAKNAKATVLYLWNEKDEKRSEEAVTTLVDMGIRVLDLTQGLTPFMLVEEDKDKNDTVDTLAPLTRNDYEAMPLSTLKQHAVAQGVNDKSDKEEIINALLGESDEKQVAKNGTVTVVFVFEDTTVKVVKVTEQHAQKLLSDLK